MATLAEQQMAAELVVAWLEYLGEIEETNP